MLPPIDMTITEGDHVHHVRHGANGEHWVAIVTRKTEAGPFSVAAKVSIPDVAKSLRLDGRTADAVARRMAEQNAHQKMNAELPGLRAEAATRRLYTSLLQRDPKAQALMQKIATASAQGHPVA